MRLKIFFLVAILLLVTSAFFPHRVSAQECGASPSAPTNVKAVSGPKAGEVILFWDGAAHANRYAVAYGTKSNSYQYGAHNIGGEPARSYTIKSLQPGVRYYFRLAAARDCSSSPFSSEVSAVAKGAKVEVKKEGEKVVVGAPKAEVVPVTTVISTSGPVGKPRLSVRSGPRVGEVTLSWQHVDSAEDYHLVYGRTLGKYEYGALNIGKVDRFIVRSLQPGTTYYFAIIPIFNNRPLYTTEAVKGVARADVTVIQTTPEALIKPKEFKVPVVKTEPTKAPSTKTEEVPLATSSPEAKTTPTK